MKIELDGKTALITASSKGIGFGVAKVLMMSGADVVLLSRNEEHLQEARSTLHTLTGKDSPYIVADLTKREDLQRVIKEVNEIGAPDIFFFSTGGPRPGYFMEMSMRDWEHAADLLLYPAVYLAKNLLPLMMERKWGRIIYSTSIAIKEPIPTIALSNVVRVSLAGLVRTLAKEVGRRGVTVNGIMPGVIKTGRILHLAEDEAERTGRTTEEIIERYGRENPTGRIGGPEDIGYLATFLASDFSAHINGAMIPVDGGALHSVF
jgi:3-oxoacyl-[acyl-carrier protein] reductase